MLQVKAYHLERRISILNLRKKITDYKKVKREHSFLLYDLGNESYFYAKDYGSLVFINCSEGFISEMLNAFLPDNKSVADLPSENYSILFEDKIEVDFETIYVKELNLDVAHVIMLNLAQSVAIMNYVNKTSDLHAKTLVYSKQLEKTGRVKLSKLQMRKFIGKTMNLKNNIAEDLFIFDTSDVAWSQKELSTLDYKLKDEFEIVNRYHGIKNSLDTIKENLDLFNDLLQHKYSSMLEWIIIILILFEVIQVIIEKIY